MKNAPFITKPVAQKDILIGTMNPNALAQPLLQKKTINKSYEKIAELTTTLDRVKNENKELQDILDGMVNAEKPTPFCQFKKWELDFHQRLKDREEELSAFSRFVDTFRTESSPTFVKVDAANLRRPDFDSICVSLLVSNPEKYFFNKDDLLQVNQQLTCLIDQQAEALKLLSARLKLFTSYQHKFTVQTTINSLKNNEIPSALAGAAPTRALELKTKRKMLSAELAVLVKVRRDLVNLKLFRKMKLRRKRMRIKLSVRINKVIRGYLVRTKLKQLKKAAVIIQKVWRGYSQRWHQKQAEMNFDDFMDSEGRRFRMVKKYKHRINPDGEEEEYYEYEEEEIKEDEIPETKPKSKHKKKYASDYEEEEEEEEEEDNNDDENNFKYMTESTKDALSTENAHFLNNQENTNENENYESYEDNNENENDDTQENPGNNENNDDNNNENEENNEEAADGED